MEKKGIEDKRIILADIIDWQNMPKKYGDYLN